MTCGCESKSCKICLKKTKKYVREKCVLKLTIKDIPTKLITNTTFSFADIAKDILRIEERVYSNEVIQQFIKDPLIFDPVLINKANRILVNICLNVINDPLHPPPAGFVKRATIVSTEGNVMVDVTTYINEPEGIAIGLDKDKNIINMRSYQNIFDKSQNNLNQIIYYDNLSIPKTSPYLTQDLYFNSNNIDPKGLTINNPGLISEEINVLVFSDKNYTYPADEINPPPTEGTATRFKTIINHGVREEIQQARIQDWGYASRRSSSFIQRPCYYVAHDTDLSVDGYSITLRMAYLKYK